MDWANHIDACRHSMAVAGYVRTSLCLYVYVCFNVLTLSFYILLCIFANILTLLYIYYIYIYTYVLLLLQLKFC